MRFDNLTLNPRTDDHIFLDNVYAFKYVCMLLK